MHSHRPFSHYAKKYLGKFRRRLALGLGLLGVGLYALAPIRHLFDPGYLIAHLQRLGPGAGAIYVLLYATITTVGLPGSVLAIAAGGVFGAFWGTVWTVMGATLGAVIAFGLARTLLHAWVERTFGHHRLLQQLNQAIHHRPLNFVLAIRFTPISPFNLVNFLFGLTPIRLKTYAFGTFIGIIPGTFAYTWLGAAGTTAWQGGDRWPLMTALMFLTLLSLVPFLQASRSR